MGSFRNSYLTFLGYSQLRVSRSIIDLNQKIQWYQVQTKSFIHFLQYKFEYIRQFVSWPKSWFFCSCFLVQIKVEKWNKELGTMGWNQFSEGEVLLVCSKVQLLPKPSLKIRTANGIFWISLGIFRYYGLKNILFCFSR